MLIWHIVIPLVNPRLTIAECGINKIQHNFLSPSRRGRREEHRVQVLVSRAWFLTSGFCFLTPISFFFLHDLCVSSRAGERNAFEFGLEFLPREISVISKTMKILKGGGTA
jgi:hypothetical protein